MATMTEDERRGGLDRDAWLQAVLPIVRVRRRRPWTIVPLQQEVVALYRDELVVARARATVPVPDAAYDAGGAAAVRAFGGPSGSTAVRLDEVRRLTAQRRSALGKHDQVWVGAPARAVRFRVLHDNTPNLYDALSILLGDRFRRRNWIPPLGAFWRIPVLLVLGALWACTFYGMQTDPLAWGGLPILLYPILSALVAPLGVVWGVSTIPYFPGKGGGKRQRTGPDLSRRRPIKLRPAGIALAQVGALLLLGSFFANLAGTVVRARGLDPNDREGLGPLFRACFEVGVATFVTPGLVGTSAPVLVVMISAVLYVLAILVSLVLVALAPSPASILALLALACPYLGLVMVYAGRSLAATTARRAIAGDPRPPVLYLRSFEDDTEDRLTPQTFLSTLFGITVPAEIRKLPMWLRVAYELHPCRLLRTLLGRVTSTTELQLGGFFQQFGPFVAIGRPGERLAVLGAAREYVGDEDWQDVVIEFMAKSRFVVLQAARTGGFLWEAAAAFERADPRKILYCLSNFRGRQDDYENFRVQVERIAGWRLPRNVGNLPAAQFLFFESDRTPRLHALSFASPLSWPFRGQVADLASTLADFVDRDRPDAGPYAPRDHPGHAPAALLLYVTIAPLLWSLLLLGLITVAGRVAPPAASVLSSAPTGSGGP